MSVLGIDPSLNSTGYCELLDDGKLGAYGTLKSKEKGLVRLEKLYRYMQLLLSLLKPKLIACEAYSFGSVGQVFQIGEGGGVFRLAFQQAGYVEGNNLFFVPPKSLKLYIAGSGNADKDQMIKAIRKRWGIDFGKKNDEADAYALATVAALLCKSSTTGMSASALELLKKIRPK